MTFMKHLLTACAAIVLAATSLSAQKVELNAFANYMFGASNDYYYNNYNGNLYIEPSIVYGGAIDVDLRNNMMLELQYAFQPTTVRIEGYAGSPSDNGSEINIHFIQIGGLYHKDVNDKVTMFGGLLFGMEIFAPANQAYDSETRFLGSLTGGAKIWLNDKIGLRLNANLNMPMIFSGAGFYLGTGGSGYGVSTVIQLFQFSLGGGLVFKL